MCLFEAILGRFHGFAAVIVLAMALLSLVLACFAFFARRKLTLACFGLAVTCQLILLTLLMTRRTPLIAFEARLPAGSPVLAPELYDALWLAFVGSTLLAIVACVSPRIWHRLRDNPDPPRVGRVGVASVVLQAIILAAVVTSLSTLRGEVRQMSIVSEPSADGYEVRLVAYDCWIDVNGVILYREPGDFWWRSIGTVGDFLTQSRYRRFEWLGPSTAALVLDAPPGEEGRVQIDCAPPRLGEWSWWSTATQPASAEN